MESSEGTILKFREMVEVVLGLGSVVGLSWWIPGSWRESHLIFCAFFIVIFAIAVRYHTIVAYSASSLAAIGYGLLLWLHPEMRVQPNFLYLALEPSLLLIGGICTSDILRWQRQRLKTLEQKCTHADQALQKTQERYQIALATNETLERQVGGQSTSIITLSEKIARLWKLDGDERYTAILDLVVYAVEAQSCSLYLQHESLWRLHAEQSREDSVHTPVLNTDDPLIKRVIEQREVKTVLDSLTEEKIVSREAAVMAGPLLDESGEMVGMVVIDNISLLKFTPGTVRLFSSLLQIVSISFQTGRSAIPKTHHGLALTIPGSDITTPALPALSSSSHNLSIPL